jgi:hypothetical protein
VDEVYRHPCNNLAPQSAKIHHSTRLDLRAIVRKYIRPRIEDKLTSNQIKRMCSDALDSALETDNEPDFEPDEVVDRSEKAQNNPRAPRGCSWRKK